MSRSPCRRIPAAPAALLVFVILPFADASIRLRLSMTPISGLSRHLSRKIGYCRSPSENTPDLSALNLRGGSEDNGSEGSVDPKDDEVAALANTSDDITDGTAATPQTKGWFTKKKDIATDIPKEENEGYLEFTMNSSGETTIQAPKLQNELNKTLSSLNELQNKVIQEDITKQISANGVANGGASGHMSAKFPISREELPHFACMSVLMFLFIYVFTTGEKFV